MVNSKIIAQNIILFKGLENHLIELVKKYRLLEEKAKAEPHEILRKWYYLCNENYALSRRRVTDFLFGPGIREDSLEEFQYQRQIGMVLMPIILNFVNAFEYISTLLILNSNRFNKSLENIIKPKIDSLNTKWEETNKDLKQSVIGTIRFSKNSISVQRKVLRKMSLIQNADDFSFLCFVWSIRNAMHNNFINTEEVKYVLKDEDTGRELNYHIPKGKGIQFWDTPKWNIVITERLANIMRDIIKGLDDLPLKKEEIIDL